MEPSNFIIAACMLLMVACSSKKGSPASNKPKLSEDKSYFLMTEISSDSTYAYTPSNPVQVGYNGSNNGPENEHKYLRGLKGPKGQKVSFYRISSCCPFEDSKLPFGTGLLDKYNVRWEGMEKEEEKIIYIDMYRYKYIKAPLGFSLKK